MRARPRRIDSILTLVVLLTLLTAATLGAITLRRYTAFTTLSEAGARYAAVHGRLSDATYVRPFGTTEALRKYLADRHVGEELDVFVSPNEPNLLAPGTTVTVTVSGPWISNQRLASLLHFTLKASSSATVIQ